MDFCCRLYNPDVREFFLYPPYTVSLALHEKVSNEHNDACHYELERHLWLLHIPLNPDT